VASARDPFNTRSQVPDDARGATFDTLPACVQGPPGSPLTLREALSRALCANVEARNAWAVIEERAAGLGQSKAAYLPTLTATGQWLRENNTSNVRDHAELSSNYSSSVNADTVSLEWMLYDFGERGAALDSAKALLRAAQATHEAVVQQAIADAAKAYFSAVAAHARVQADSEVLDNAAHSLDAAQERVGRGVAPVTEAYQAEVAREQARVSLERDRGQALAAQGVLADAMGLDPATPLILKSLDDAGTSEGAFQGALTSLMHQATTEHPAVLAAERALDAARAAAEKTKAQGRPSIKFVGQYSRNNQPVQQGQGFPHYPASGHDGYVGVQVVIPVFSGYANTYQTRQAEAQVDEQAVALDKTRRQVALQVWTSYQTLQSDSENLAVSAHLVTVADQAWQSAQRRYQLGIGTILELLSTQTSLAQAQQGRVEALTTWRFDRLALGSALGQLGPSDLAK
jgi:outer membrane protein